MTPWIILGTIAAAVLARMVDWDSKEWSGFIGAIVGGFIAIVGAAVTAVVQIRAAFKRQDAKIDTKLDTLTKATNGNLSKAINTVADKVMEAAKVNPLEETAFPTTPEQLREFARQVAAETAKQIKADQPPKIQT